MNDAIFEILDRAKTNVEDGERDADEALREAFDTETDNEWVCWELMKDVYSPDELLRGDVSDGYTPLYDYVYGEIHTDVEDYIEENTWTVFYCDEPEEGCDYDHEDCVTEDEFLEAIKVLTDDGWKVIKQSEKEAWLYEPEEEEGDE